MTEPLAVGIHAVEKANIRGDEVPLVIGCGPVGLAVIAALKIKGLIRSSRRTIPGAARAGCKDGRRRRRRPRALAAVRDLGRTCADVGRAESRAAAVAGDVPALKPALIFECVGIPGLLQQVFEGAPRDARIVVVGVCMETDRAEPFLGIVKELNVQYVLAYTPEEFACALRLIAEGKVDAASMVTASVGSTASPELC